MEKWQHPPLSLADIRIEGGDRVRPGPGKVQLLELVAKHGSIERGHDNAGPPERGLIAKPLGIAGRAAELQRLGDNLDKLMIGDLRHGRSPHHPLTQARERLGIGSAAVTAALFRKRFSVWWPRFSGSRLAPGTDYGAARERLNGNERGREVCTLPGARLTVPKGQLVAGVAVAKHSHGALQRPQDRLPQSLAPPSTGFRPVCASTGAPCAPTGRRRAAYW